MTHPDGLHYSEGDMGEPVVESLRVLHEDVDRRAGELARVHAKRLNCRRGCHDCCIDGIRVFEIEADRIRRHHARLLEQGEPHAPGWHATALRANAPGAHGRPRPGWP